MQASQYKFRAFIVITLLTLVAALAVSAVAQEALELSTVSTRPDMVTGGDVLIRIDVPETVQLDQVVVQLNGQDVTGVFQPDVNAQSLLGLVEGLQEGENTLTAVRDEEGQQPVSLTLINHPITGPVFSGPHQQPFFCQTEEFTLPTGETLGPPIDRNCSVETRIGYVYRSTDRTLKRLPDPAAHPEDLAQITTIEGDTVPYIVRVETGTINRAIYQTAILHDPVTQPRPDVWTQSPGWNGRLIYTFGGGCRTGWYVQGPNTAVYGENYNGSILDDFMLSQGYATASASLNVFGNNCDDLLAAETMMMVKERFIESYGAPRFTIGWGCSGGSYQVHQIGDNYPGLLDGIIPGCSFPEVGFATTIKLAETRLLENYFNIANAAGEVTWTEEEQRAVSGFAVWESIPNLSAGAARIDPVPREDRASAEFKDVVPQEVRYHPTIYPGGARPTVYDHAVNVYGRDPETGFARRPLDNVGVQYGLETLNLGQITVEQFLDLNERIGGYDIDTNFIPERTVADLEATRAAYQTGRLLNGGGGLATMPIIDYRAYSDDREGGDIHMRFHSFSTRERLIEANGHADNQVMLVEDFTYGLYSSESPVLQEALRQMDQWLVNLEQIASDEPTPAEVVQAKPADLVDACWTPEGEEEREKIVEEQTYEGPGMCNELYPSFPAPRLVAGGPLANDIIKCQLKSLDPADYTVEFTPEQWERLENIFPEGVCDWTQPGVEQQPLADTWLRFGD